MPNTQTMFVNIHTHNPTGRAIEIATAGVHPWDAGHGNIAETESAIGHIDAIGEIGLDYACNVDRTVQQNVFDTQLGLAERSGLPVVLHCVKAFEPVMKTLAKYRLKAVIFHGFIGSREQMRRAVEAGYYLSFGERAFASPKTMEAMREIPKERMFLETDDTPTDIAEIYRRAAEVTGIDIETLKRKITDNYNGIFGRTDE